MERKSGEKAKGHNLKPIIGKETHHTHENAGLLEEFHLQNPTLGLQHKAIDILGS